MWLTLIKDKKDEYWCNDCKMFAAIAATPDLNFIKIKKNKKKICNSCGNIIKI